MRLKSKQSNSINKIKISKSCRAANNSYHHGDLRNKLLHAAVAIVKKNGLEGLSLRKIAAFVGVSHTAPAHHFGNLRGLLAALATQGFIKLAELMQRSMLQADNPLAGFLAAGKAYVSYAEKYTSIFRIMHHASLEKKTDLPELLRASQAAFTVLIEAITSCQKANLLKKGEPSLMALAAWSLAHGLSVLAIDRQLPGKGIVKAAKNTAQGVLNELYLGFRL
ncbi:MAG: TetR/AcrR family transcriptional regulator [Deltaproteobacteria bacterium]|nr:TetR/AcrR family transcriptional regulator [Deltaproteobacteria bacterium]